ncbi:hypothetical protein ACERK3_06110 [Phycisphaerales bacterium AB-hyl4]|uniref:CAAX prenyl protease-like protein n=1 Tax=Natronomicrosphaera hydrolytica TaxID=3242702 RepID=A0ABV4U2Q5_9BACT
MITTHPAPQRLSLLDRFDALPWHLFLLILFTVRWPLVVLGSIIAHRIFAPPNIADPFADMDPFLFFVYGVFISPFVETVIECTLPYALMRKLRGDRFNITRPWSFMVVSAVIMVALHPIAIAIFPAFITGFIYAYGYARFARETTLAAIILITALHGFSNLVGITVYWLVIGM